MDFNGYELVTGDLVVTGYKSENNGGDWFDYIALSDQNSLNRFHDNGSKFNFESLSSGSSIVSLKNFGKIISENKRGYWVEIL